MLKPLDCRRVVARAPRKLATLVVAGAIALLAAGAAAAAVDFNRENDYFAALRTGGIKVVDMYHLGPCEQRLQQRDYPRAANECRFILKIFPNHPTALALMARICEQWKSPTCMLDDAFDRAFAINPRAPSTYVVLGIHRHKVRDYAGAIESYRRALDLDPDYMNAHYNLALAYIKTKQYELANEHAQRAYALGATLPGLRDLLVKAGHWKPVVPGAAADASPDASGTTSAPVPAGGDAPK